MNRRVFLTTAAGAALHAAPPARITDTHTHFYDPARPQGVPWPGKGEPVLYRTTRPDRFAAVTSGLGVTGTVVVEASPWLEDNQWVLDLAKEFPVIVGLVGHLDPGTPEFRTHLERFRKNRLFLGIRLGGHVVGERLGSPAFVDDLKRMADAGLELDVAGPSSLFAEVVRLTDRLPSLRVVLNHLPLDPPEGALREMRGRKQVYAKVSGVLRRAGGYVPADASFYRASLDPVWEVFGEDRLVYGSNWPVSDLLAPYATVLGVVREYFAAKGAGASEKYFWKNSQAAYRWSSPGAG